MKKYLFLAATAFVFAACTNNEVDAPQVAETSPQAVAFDTYMSSATRAYTSGVMTTELLGDPGFGVFTYHNLGDGTNAGTYNPAETPNFMYNQKVEFKNNAWTYEPLKYWPNETGTDMLNATGAAYSGTVATPTKKDVLSFFAYAPWVTAGSGTKGTDAGINAMVANTGTTDPFVTYTISKVPSGSVDLVWGVAPAGGLSYTAVNNDAISIDEGLPLKNLVKPSKDQKIKFLFQHALARIGMTVVAAVDQIAPGGTLDTNTKIYVNSITLADNAHTIPTYGDLNLNNTSAGVANWINTNAASANFSVTINASNELNTDLQNISGKPGVTTKETKVIAQAGTPLKDQYLMLITTPGTDAVFNVTIDYDVITTDANLNGGKSTVNNVITKQITLSSTNTFDSSVTGFINNKAYNLKLILGMTSVKLDAEVADWEVDGSTNVDLPRNEE